MAQECSFDADAKFSELTEMYNEEMQTLREIAKQEEELEELAAQISNTLVIYNNNVYVVQPQNESVIPSEQTLEQVRQLEAVLITSGQNQKKRDDSTTTPAPEQATQQKVPMSSFSSKLTERDVLLQIGKLLGGRLVRVPDDAVL